MMKRGYTAQHASSWTHVSLGVVSNFGRLESGESKRIRSRLRLQSLTAPPKISSVPFCPKKSSLRGVCLNPDCKIGTL
jgi:hypothetical protein